MTTSAVRLDVPFVDLKAQYRSIKDEVLDTVSRVFDNLEPVAVSELS